MLPWLMNPRPPSATLSNNHYRLLLSAHSCTLRNGCLRELHKAGAYTVPLERSSRALPAGALLKAPGSARATEVRPLPLQSPKGQKKRPQIQLLTLSAMELFLLPTRTNPEKSVLLNMVLSFSVGFSG